LPERQAETLGQEPSHLSSVLRGQHGGQPPRA
jgi:hypothetical protein